MAERFFGRNVGHYVSCGISDHCRQLAKKYVTKVGMFQALGDGAVAQVVLSKGTHGRFFSITFGFAMAITFGVYISGNTSGTINYVFC